MLRQLNHEATNGLAPDITILLDIPSDAGLSRVNEKNRLDREPLPFHQAIRKGFLAEARRDPKRWRILDASKPQVLVLEQALQIFQESFSP
jgi:dTMP kinase